MTITHRGDDMSRQTMTGLEKRLVDSERKARAVASQLQTLLAPFAPPAGSRYLDVGCGNGAATLAVARAYGLEATGIDVDPAQVALARAAGKGNARVHFVEADATRLPFADASFDAVASSKATHHIQAWTEALAEMARVIRPGGHLVYTDLVLPGPLAWLAARLRKSEPPTRARLDATFESLGLTPVHRRTAGLVYEAVLRRPTVVARGESYAPAAASPATVVASAG
jgi:ubiquinone/menaquinone biosynthesis C-methylase UbiE